MTKLFPNCLFHRLDSNFVLAEAMRDCARCDAKGGSFFGGFPTVWSKNHDFTSDFEQKKHPPFRCLKWLSSQQQMTDFDLATEDTIQFHEGPRSSASSSGARDGRAATGAWYLWFLDSFFFGKFEKQKRSATKKRVVSFLRVFGYLFSFFWLNRWSDSIWKPGKALRPKAISRLSNHVTPYKVGPY